MFAQGQKWHLKLKVDVGELENKHLLEEIAAFEKAHFEAAPGGASKFLPALNEGASPALMQIVGPEASRLYGALSVLSDQDPI
jgi:hypothetical protein